MLPKWGLCMVKEDSPKSFQTQIHSACSSTCQHEFNLLYSHPSFLCHYPLPQCSWHWLPQMATSAHHHPQMARPVPTTTIHKWQWVPITHINKRWWGPITTTTLNKGPAPPSKNNDEHPQPLSTKGDEHPQPPSTNHIKCPQPPLTNDYKRPWHHSQTEMSTHEHHQPTATITTT